ncbi:MAG: 16S rRNA (guanine(527)-N(7))-methyltransferase RsmG [Salinivirgaceae bacterium]|jgi:16S rRNA (guanine527-N7)-methyltransferase|nr:16S rRNA (guanine(527)-N(7))-methyltransferase RsmG [Salinivirgaceae bacterium]
MHLIEKYFPNLNKSQINAFKQLGSLYTEWNEKINVISRKDIDKLYTHHVLHSLAIAKVIQFVPDTRILDVGTGGGFPGIPLAIMFPKTKFHLIDSIGKKITVVNGVAEALKLENVRGEQIRVESVKNKYDFIISRAVTRFDKFRTITRKNINSEHNNKLKNGILYLKGGDFKEELTGVEKKIKLYNISDFFEDSFFETKKVIHLAIW